ncbi:MAG: DUF512 domain-containing protein [Actinobacteria bacterium]|nr:MAG: DUF512 domain-containing protein [Actinomycetota bacterium]
MYLKVRDDSSLFKSSDLLSELNGQKINDVIDLRFYLQEENEVLIIREGKEHQVSANLESIKRLNFFQEVPKVKKCSNSCVFCFIDQLPQNLRDSLYFKDDDWRLSFLTGNFVTLTNLEAEERERIVKQRISPLYVSVHAVDKKVRQKLGFNKIDNAIDNLRFLDNSGINTHLQVVLCPGINDNSVLEQTLDKLRKLKNVKSVGIVPVGLTKYHKEDLSLFNKPKASALIDFICKEQQRSYESKGYNWIYCADEFYLLAGEEIPNAAYYDDFSQLENGIGLVRKFIDGFNKGELYAKESYVIVTGADFAPVLRESLRPKNEKGHFKVKAIENEFFGSKITVAGLLTATDIINQVKEKKLPVLIPDIMVNDEQLFLDNVSFAQVKKKIPSAYLVPSKAEGFIEWLNNFSN